MIAELQACIRDGDPRGLAELYAAGARLEAFLPHETIVRRGGRSIVDLLTGWWSKGGAIVHWEATEYPAGVDVTFERHPLDDERPWTSRQWHELHLTDGRIATHRIWSDRPRHIEAFEPLPDAIAAIVGDAERRPAGEGGASGSGLEAVVATDGTRYVLKHVRPAADLLLRETHDPGREALLFTSAVLANAGVIDYPVVAVAAEGDGWAILLRDVSESLLTNREPLASGGLVTDAERRAILTAVGSLHDAFRDRRFEWAVSLTDRLRMLGPQAMAAAGTGPEALPRYVSGSWRAFFEIAPADVGAAVAAIHENPAELATTLENETGTLIHGDLWAPNIGLSGDRVVLLDWALACTAPPEMEYAFWAIWNTDYTSRSSAELLDEARSIAGGRVNRLAMQLALLAEFASNAGARAWALNGIDDRDPDRRDRERADLAWWFGAIRSVLDDVWAPRSVAR